MRTATVYALSHRGRSEPYIRWAEGCIEVGGTIRTQQQLRRFIEALERIGRLLSPGEDEIEYHI